MAHGNSGLHLNYNADNQNAFSWALQHHQRWQHYKKYCICKIRRIFAFHISIGFKPYQFKMLRHIAVDIYPLCHIEDIDEGDISFGNEQNISMTNL